METYCGVLQRIKSRGHGKETQKIFPWIAASKQLLSLSQLREAIAIEIGQQYLKPERLYNDIKNIASWCENFIEVDEEYQLVQFSHSTIRKFITGEPLESTLANFHVNLEEVDHDIGEICVTYLNFNDFKTGITRRPRPRLLHDTTQIAQSALGYQSVSAIMLAKLRPKLASKPVDLSSFQSLTAMGSSTTYENLVLGHPFLDYASTNWILHTKNFRQEISKTWKLWETMVIYGHNLAKPSWGENTFNVDGPILKWAFNAHHYALIRLIASADGLLESQRLRTINDSAKENDVNALRILLEGQDLGSKLGDALQLAAKGGHLEVVERLLAAKAAINAGNAWSKGRTALQAAAEGGHLEVVERLIAAKADINAGSAWAEGPTALQLAAGGGYLEIVERLLAAEANVNAGAAEFEGLTALKAAAEGGHLEVVERLLAAKANVNAGADEFEGCTALQAAIAGGHLEIISRLKQAGAFG
jgi:TusA-related sulfurtransferase